MAALPVPVVGAGFAGLAAADALASGLRVAADILQPTESVIRYAPGHVS